MTDTEYQLLLVLLNISYCIISEKVQKFYDKYEQKCALFYMFGIVLLIYNIYYIFTNIVQR